jgi:hypothetical protein
MLLEGVKGTSPDYLVVLGRRKNSAGFCKKNIFNIGSF